MSIDTKNSIIIKNYYIRLEELVSLYMIYTFEYNKRLDEIKITFLETTIKEIKEQNKRNENYAIQNKKLVRNLTEKITEIENQNDELLDFNEKIVD